MQIQANRQQRNRPKLDVEGTHWRADLRGLGFGRYRVALTADVDREEAMHLAYELLARLRRDGMADIAQQELVAGAPELFASALDRCSAEKIHDTAGGKAWWREHSGLVRRELGAYKLAHFAPPDGNARIAEYVRQLIARQAGGRTIRNRISIVEQVLRFAVERGWLAAAPLHPRMPPKAAPVYNWLTEENFRALRDRIYRAEGSARLELRGFRPAEAPLVYVQRRKVYLSWLFYTGVHTADADSASADHLFVDGRQYRRHNEKSANCVPDEWFEMPDQLHADIAELLQLLDRPFRPGELFTGGPWRNVSTVMQRAALRCGFSRGANPRIMRRSYAREMFVHGYAVHEVAARMGHVSDRMLQEIYARTPRPAGTAKTRWTLSAAAPQPTGGGMARVLQLRGDHA